MIFISSTHNFQYGGTQEQKGGKKNPKTWTTYVIYTPVHILLY